MWLGQDMGVAKWWVWSLSYGGGAEITVVVVLSPQKVSNL